MNAKRPWTVALTGGIASGKTAVSDLFASLDVPVIDTDVIARGLVESGQPALDEIRRHFGDDIVDDNGELRRSRLRETIFRNPTARTTLESILHPRIREASEARLSGVAGPYAVLVVPLLVETGLFEDVDRVLVVDVPESVQIERLMQRDGISGTQAKAALAAQCKRSARLELADDVIDNSGSPRDLKRQVQALDAKFRLAAMMRHQ